VQAGVYSAAGVLEVHIKINEYTNMPITNIRIYEYTNIRIYEYINEILFVIIFHTG
jgi:hypothetical protein